MPLTHENIRLFWKLLVSSYKECPHGESKISPFPDLCPNYINKFYITNSSCESHKSRYFEIHHEVPVNSKSVLQNSKFVLHSLGPLNVQKATQKCLILWNLLGSSYKKMLIKNPKYVFHLLYVLETH